MPSQKQTVITSSNRHSCRNGLSIGQREISGFAKVGIRRNTLCISRIPKRRLMPKDPLFRRQDISKDCPTKKGAGRTLHSPRCSSRFAYCAYIPFVFSPTDLHLGGQNLAALGTTAGQNLAAVGSSQSLTETVDLGTVTLAGLIGTLHYITPPAKK